MKGKQVEKRRHWGQKFGLQVDGHSDHTPVDRKNGQGRVKSLAPGEPFNTLLPKWVSIHQKSF